MTKKMSLLLTGMLLCLAPDIKGNETDGRIKGIVMDGELGGPLEFVTVQVKAKGSDKYCREPLPEVTEITVSED